MGSRKGLLVFWVLILALNLSVTIASSSDYDIDDDSPALLLQQPNSDLESALQMKLNKLRSKIHSLESNMEQRSMEQRSMELQAKDDAVSKREKVTNNVASLQQEITLVQEQLAANAAAKAAKSNAQFPQLQQQEIKALKEKIESQNKKRDALEAQTMAAEIKARELSAKLQSEELLRAQLEASFVRRQMHETQASIAEYLQRHEYTKQLATTELIWFMVATLLVLTVSLLYCILSQIFSLKLKTKQY